ncbi:cytochrome c3 family protein [Nitrosophilus labii]|uniref:cytochrome c3 family protein n=1 Tax=Nitrosophilus labii TaxID=2706014 RepID=UPI001656E8AB|nr:cytochrome c3 family protein [Nitrosophilus labii]
MMRAKIGKIAAAVLLTVGVTSAVAQIANSKHDLTASNTNPDVTIKASAGQNNDEICVYCHTPHAANTAFAGAPLWNKNDQNAPTTYTMYGTTVAGTQTLASPQAPSLACLSCHDGVSAINSIVNAPGSGGYVETGQYVAFGTTAAGTAFTMPAGVTQIGTDLTNDHPVSIPYTTGAASLKDPTTALPGTWNGATTIGDLLRGGNVECVSCHDPHAGENPTFLRMANGNVGSQLCLACHAK